jgi:hypothetical protein
VSAPAEPEPGGAVPNASGSASGLELRGAEGRCVARPHGSPTEHHVGGRSDRCWEESVLPGARRLGNRLGGGDRPTVALAIDLYSSAL